MDLLQLIGFAAIGVLFIVSSWLVIWCDYEDGIVGKLGLIMVALGTLVRIIEASEGDAFQFSDVSIIVLVGMSIFMLRHLYRAWKHKRVAR